MGKSYVLTINLKMRHAFARNIVRQKVEFNINDDLSDDHIVYNFTGNDSTAGDLDSLDKVLMGLKKMTINSTWEKCFLNSDNFNYFREGVLGLNDPDIYFTEENQEWKLAY